MNVTLEQKHSGVVAVSFFTYFAPPKNGIGAPVPEEEVKSQRLYTNMDAGAVYRRLRQRHPELAEYHMTVRIVPAGEYRWSRDNPQADDRKMLTAKRIDTSIWRVDEGQHPLEKVTWLGELPDVPFVARSGPLSVESWGEMPTATINAANLLMNVFAADRMEWA